MKQSTRFNLFALAYICVAIYGVLKDGDTTSIIGLIMISNMWLISANFIKD